MRTLASYRSLLILPLVLIPLPMPPCAQSLSQKWRVGQSKSKDKPRVLLSHLPPPLGGISGTCPRAICARRLPVSPAPQYSARSPLPTSCHQSCTGRQIGNCAGRGARPLWADTASITARLLCMSNVECRASTHASPPAAHRPRCPGACGPRRAFRYRCSRLAHAPPLSPLPRSGFTLSTDTHYHWPTRLRPNSNAVPAPAHAHYHRIPFL